MSNIKILNDITVFNNITALSTVNVGDLIVRGNFSTPETTLVRSNSAKWDGVYTTVQNNSATWSGSGGGSGVGSLSVAWQNTSNTVSSFSANWTDGYNKGVIFSGVSGNYDNTYAIVSSLSTNWNAAFNYVLSVSANETQQQANSANWDNTFNTVSSLSTNWSDGYNKGVIFAGISGNYNNVYSTVSSLSTNWNSAYNTSLVYSSNSANPVLSTFTTNISGSVPKLAVGTTAIPDPSIELYVLGDVTVTGNISAAGSMTFTNTYFNTTSALSVVNNGTGPTLVAVQYGDQPIAAFYDGENQNAPALWVDGATTRPGYVGIGTKTPNVELAVSGRLSALSASFNALTLNGPISSNSSITTNTLSVNSVVVNGLLSASSFSPHNHTAAQVTDFYSAALSATRNQMIIYSMLFG